MTTATIIQATKINKVERSISTSYTSGTYRVSVRTSFYKNSKTYVSSVTESRLEFRGDYTVEISQLNIGSGEQRLEDDFRKVIQSVKTEKYNFKDLEKYQTHAVFEANDSLIIAELFIKGKTNSEIYGKDN